MLRSAYDIARMIRTRVEASGSGAVVDGTALAYLIEAVANSIHEEALSASGSLDIESVIASIRTQISLLEQKANDPLHSVDTKAVAEILWAKLEKKRDEEKDAFIRELEKM